MRRSILHIVFLASVLAACDGLVEQVDEEQMIVGRYVAIDSLLVRFHPADGYDEENESPFLADTTFKLLESGGSLQLILATGSGNKGNAQLELIFPDSLFLDADSTYLLTPDTTLTFDGDYITVIDRVILEPPTEVDDEEEYSAAVPLRWLVQPGGRLLGVATQPVIRPVTRFDTQRGRFVTNNENLGTLYVGASVSKE